MNVRAERQQFTVSKLIEFLEAGKLRLYDLAPRDIRWAFGTRYASRVIELMFLRISVDDGMWPLLAPDVVSQIRMDVNDVRATRWWRELVGGGA